MNADTAPIAKGPGFFRRALLLYQTETGQSPGLWALVALLSFIAQIVFRRELAPGEFGTLNALLAIIGLLTVPAAALWQAHRLYSAHANLPETRPGPPRESPVTVAEIFAWIWSACCFALILPAARLKARAPAFDRDFLPFAAATLSVLLGIYLFTNADRIAAQSWFGVATDNNLRVVNWPLFDAYQAAGLLARALLWGTQPLLWILFAQRSRLDRTTPASLAFFWIYLGALLLGAILLGWLAQPLSRLFCGADFQSTAFFVPSFAAVMVPLGLLQGLGIFALASRRYPECFVLGGCGVGYALLLYFAGRQPQLMLAYMFGGGLISLMAALFVGVVRWGRNQP